MFQKRYNRMRLKSAIYKASRQTAALRRACGLVGASKISQFRPYYKYL
jgi:hypothetical protein